MAMLIVKQTMKWIKRLLEITWDIIFLPSLQAS
jgi:hypothetical protein